MGASWIDFQRARGHVRLMKIIMSVAALGFFFVIGQGLIALRDLGGIGLAAAGGFCVVVTAWSVARLLDSRRLP
jgi:hypothetical protein